MTADLFTSLASPLLPSLSLLSPPFSLRPSLSSLPFPPLSLSPSPPLPPSPFLCRHSPRYLPDFVLHGTSDPPDNFSERMSKDLANVVKVRQVVMAHVVLTA